MPKYSVILEGKNFPVLSDGKTELLGFMTTRKVKACDIEEAELKAIELIKQDSSLMSSLDQNHEATPEIYLDSIYALKWWNRLGGKGYTFFNMGE
ncbi:hypothetical protein H4J57_19030 [Colwellia sp. BRX8-7]|jgi:hypothetical protein|uniref:hypothetical protein n=1 Tax=Colwellia sp. BRX8-7 TaxID=2759833 RepID=UPI0015F57F42|nr:hypothetical protein [Colwellia sp. BRX8-7]MBA6339284.1 hypothetical protein [Colwellia sp. BRX8-7]